MVASTEALSSLFTFALTTLLLFMMITRLVACVLFVTDSLLYVYYLFRLLWMEALRLLSPMIPLPRMTAVGFCGNGVYDGANDICSPIFPTSLLFPQADRDNLLVYCDCYYPRRGEDDQMRT